MIFWSRLRGVYRHLLKLRSRSLSEEEVRRQSEARQAVVATLDTIGTSLTQESQLRAKDLHANSAAITKQQKDLEKQTAKLTKQTAQWDKALTKSTKQLNEIGDLQNWAEVLERDLLVLERTVELAGNAPNAT